MNRAEKQQEIEYLSDCFARAQVALLADYRGLNVEQVRKLRRTLKSKGAFGRVVKNTLCQLSLVKGLKGASEAEINKFKESIVGPSMVVFSFDDAVTPAKVISDFAKENDKLKIRAGWLEGACMDSAGVELLAKMPSREQTLAQLLALINTPATQLARLIGTPGTQVARVIEAHRANLEAKGPAA